MPYSCAWNFLELYSKFGNLRDIQFNCCHIKNSRTDVKLWLYVLNIDYFQIKTNVSHWTDTHIWFFRYFFWVVIFSTIFLNLMGIAAVDDDEIEKFSFAGLKFIILVKKIVLLQGIPASLWKSGHYMHSSPF